MRSLLTGAGGATRVAVRCEQLQEPGFLEEGGFGSERSTSEMLCEKLFGDGHDRRDPAFQACLQAHLSPEEKECKRMHMNKDSAAYKQCLRIRIAGGSPELRFEDERQYEEQDEVGDEDDEDIREDADELCDL